MRPRSMPCWTPSGSPGAVSPRRTAPTRPRRSATRPGGSPTRRCASGCAPVSEALREVDGRVYVRRHTSYDLNVGLVVGDGACLVIDTREYLCARRELAESVRLVTPDAWTVVNTHAHFDHCLGTAAFAPADMWSLD